MAKKKTSDTARKMGVTPAEKSKKYNLLKDVQESPLYGKSLGLRSEAARDIIKENCERVQKIVPGQLVYFKYFEPKTKEELEYYDAMPLTIYFNAFNTAEGRRVLGFNLHYYPPKMRFNIMNLIYKLFKPMFDQTWDSGVQQEQASFNYSYIVEQLDKYNLTFGVRMYDPRLMGDARVVPAKWMATSLFTEGLFKKRTRRQILHHWKTWSPSGGKKNKNTK